jgi:hypothetical protein
MVTIVSIWCMMLAFLRATSIHRRLILAVSSRSMLIHALECDVRYMRRLALKIERDVETRVNGNLKTYLQA